MVHSAIGFRSSSHLPGCRACGSPQVRICSHEYLAEIPPSLHGICWGFFYKLPPELSAGTRVVNLANVWFAVGCVAGPAATEMEVTGYMCHDTYDADVNLLLF